MGSSCLFLVEVMRSLVERHCKRTKMVGQIGLWSFLVGYGIKGLIG